jgi:iron complex outermembrane receptor protein
MHYTGKRYGDALQKEPVSGYFTADMDFGYKTRLSFGDLVASLSVLNLFDRQYVGFINASYLQNAGQTSYYPGAPRTLAFRVSLAM